MLHSNETIEWLGQILFFQQTFVRILKMKERRKERKKERVMAFVLKGLAIEMGALKTTVTRKKKDDRLFYLFSSFPISELSLNDFFYLIEEEEEEEEYLFDCFREVVEALLSFSSSSFSLFHSLQDFFNFLNFFLNKMKTKENFRKGEGLGRRERKKERKK